MTSPTGYRGRVSLAQPGRLRYLFSATWDLRGTARRNIGACQLISTGKRISKDTWTGSLVDPHLAGDLAGNESCRSSSLPTTSTAQPEVVHWDSLDATGSYSAARIAIERGQMRHGDASISVDGTLTATSCALAEIAGHASVRHAHSLLHANLHANAVNADGPGAAFQGNSFPSPGC